MIHHIAKVNEEQVKRKCLTKNWILQLSTPTSSLRTHQCLHHRCHCH